MTSDSMIRTLAGAVSQNTQMWPLLVSGASSQNGGWVPKVNILREKDPDRSWIASYDLNLEVT